MPATKYEADFTYTDAELLALYRAALARISVSGQEYTIGNRTFIAADLAEIRQMISWLEPRVNASSGPAANYARIKRPS